MFANERRVKIAEMLERRSSVTVAELTDAFQVSLETIRRDLEYLERQGALKRVHGGAITVRKMQSYSSLSARVTEHREEKRRLALAAIPYIREGDCISLDFGISDQIHELVAVQRALIDISDQIIVQADSSKFETCAALKICDLNPRFLYLTDSGLPDEILEAYKKASINIIKY